MALQAGCLFLLSIACIFLFFLRRYVNWSHVNVLNWSAIGKLPTLLTSNRSLLDIITAKLRKSGGTYEFKGPWYLGINFIVTCDPANANHMFNTHFSNYPKGDDFAEIFDVLGNGIFNVDGDMWTFQRKIGHALLASREFRSSIAKRSRDKVVSSLLPLMHQVAESNQLIDLQDLFLRFTFDTTCATVIGVDPGCLAPDFPTVPFAKALDEGEEVLFFRHIVPNVWWKLLRMLNLGEEKKMAASSAVGNRFIARCIQERKEDLAAGKERSHEDLLTSYMKNADVYSRPDSDKFLRDTLLTFLAAGKDTTGSGLSWLFWQISQNPRVEKRILEELRGVASSKLISTDMLVFDAEEIDKLVYLHATLCESLRLFPPVPFNHKVARNADVLPSGHRVRSGMRVIFSMYSMGRSKAVWGEDCMEFRPERWIAEDGKFRREPSSKFIAFHSGPRLCLGKDIALTVMKVAAAAILYNFQIQMVEGHAVGPKLSIVLQMKNGLMVTVRKRSCSGY